MPAVIRDRTIAGKDAAGEATALVVINLQDNTQRQRESYPAVSGGTQGLYIRWIDGNDLASAALNRLNTSVSEG